MKPGIFDTVTRTCTIFGILGLSTICLALIANVAFIAISILNPPIPEIKSLIVTGLDKGAAKISVEIEFPGRRFADAFHLKMEGDSQVTIGLQTGSSQIHKLATLAIKEGFNVNLASSQATRLILNDLELRFLELNSDFISEILDLENGQILMPKALQLHIQTRLVTNSLLIPLGTSINFPYTFDLSSNKKKEAGKVDKPKDGKPSTETPEEKEELSEETKKKLASFVPKRVHLSSTDQEFNIEIFESIPMDALPDFLFVQVPQMKLAVAYKDTTNPEASPNSAITFELDAFTLGNPKALNMPETRNGHVEFGARLVLNKNLYNMIKLVRDEQLQHLELSAGVEEKFASSLPKGSFMQWLSQFQIHGTIEQFLRLHENLNKATQAEKAKVPEKGQEKPTKEPEKPPRSGEMNFILRTLFESVKVKLMKVAKDESNEKSVIQARIKILRKNIITKLGLSTELLIGQIPNIGFTISKAARGHGAFDKLLAFNFESDEIQAKHKRISLKLNLSIFHFLKQKSGEGEDEFARRSFAEIKETERIRVEFNTGNVFGQILSLGDCDVYLTPQLKPERLQFLESSRSISLIKPVEKQAIIDPKKPAVEAPKIVSVKEFTKNRVDTAFVTKNEPNAAIIAAKLTIKEHEKEPPIKVFASWGDFHFSVLMNELLLLEFEIKNGFLVVGPGFLGKGVIKFNLKIPSQNENMAAFKNMIKFLLAPKIEADNNMDKDKGKGKLVGKDNGSAYKVDLKPAGKDQTLLSTKTQGIEKSKVSFKIHFGSSKDNYLIAVPLQMLKDLKDEKNSFVIQEDQNEAAKDAKTEENKEAKEQVEKDVSITDEAKEKDAPGTEESKEPSKPAKPVEPIEPTFLGDLANSILQLATFQPPTLFFHINIPDKTYCSQDELTNNFNLKITASLALPVIEARLCARLAEGDRPEACLLRAGISRPMILTTEIVDGKICFAKFKILPPDNSLLGSEAIETSTKYDFNSNEAPIHASIESLSNLIRFSEELGSKVPQFLSLSSWPEAAAVNKVIGELGSVAFAKKLPDDTVDKAKKSEKADEAKGTDKKDAAKPDEAKDKGKVQEKGKEKEKDKDTVTSDSGKKEIKIADVKVGKANPAELDLIIKSLKKNNLELYVAFSLPQFVLEGLATALEQQNWYKWTVIRWGLLDYRLYMPGVFEATIILSPGEVDLKPEGPVIAAKPVKFAIELRLSLDEKLSFGSSAVNQMISIFKQYASTAEVSMPKEFQTYLAESNLSYEMKTRGAHGWTDNSIYAVHGKFKLQSFFALFKAIQNRNSVTGKVKEETPAKKKSDFDQLAISLKTLPSNEVLEPHLNVPCLIPALCGAEMIDAKQQDQLNLFIEVKNALQPATKLASDQIGNILNALNFAKYPSHFKFNVQCLTRLQMTFMINGVGLANLGIMPFKFERTAEIAYPSTTTTTTTTTTTQLEIGESDNRLSASEASSAPKPEEDNLALKLSFSIAKTIKEFSSSLNAVTVNDIMSSLFVVPPAWYEKSENGARRVWLVNPSFNIGFGNEVLLSEEKSSLLSTLLSSALGEFAVPGFNPSDPSKEDKKDKPPGMGHEFLKLPAAMDYIKAGTCLMKSWNCDTELAATIKLTLPLPDNFLFNFNFPEKTKLTILYEDLPFLLVTLTPDQPDPNNRLVITKGTNEVLVNIRFNFQGVGVKSQDSKTFEKITESFFASEGLPVRLRVQVGDEADIETDLIIPFYKIKPQVYKFLEMKTRSMAGQSWFTKIAVNPDWFKLRREWEGPQDLEATAQKNSGDPVIDTDMTKNIRPHQRECIDGEAVSNRKERIYRLSKLTLPNTVLFLEEGKDSIIPNSEATVYLQLMTSENQPVCGLPKACSKLQLILTRQSTQHPDIKLVGFFSFKAPKSEELRFFDTTFISSLSLFKTKITLPNSGIYRVQVRCENELKKLNYITVPDLKIYARQ